MPIPKPNPNEDKQAFVARCMGNETMKKDYPDNKQRVAICLGQTRKKSGGGLFDYVLDILSLGSKYDCLECGQEEDKEGEEINEINFVVPPDTDYIDLGETEEELDIAKEKPGLWENIRKKKEREGKNYKPAKPGDPNRPSKDAWKKAQSNDSEMAIEQVMKMHDQLMAIVEKMKTMTIPLEFQEWTKDMVSKAEIYIQNIHDFVMYYEPGKYEDDDEVEEPSDLETEDAYSAEYQGRKVILNKPFRTPNGPKKFAVYTKNDSGNIVIVRFGDPNMEIKRDDPERRKNFRARHHCDTNPGPKWKARYWSCKFWSSPNVSDLT